MEKQIVMRVLKELLEKILPSDYKVIMNYRFMNGKVGIWRKTRLFSKSVRLAVGIIECTKRQYKKHVTS